jgi:RimJ/RimL family protein N-acetyltransferase
LNGALEKIMENKIINIRDLPKVIKTARLEMRALEPSFENAQMIFDAVKNENPDDFKDGPIGLEHIIPETVEEMLAIMKKTEEWTTISGQNFYVFHNNNLIGYRRIFFNEFNKSFTFAVVWLVKSAQKHGFATESMTELEEIAFEKLGANKCIRYTFPENRASIALSKKMAYHLDGINRQEYMTLDGIFRDSMIWSKLKSEFEKPIIEKK